MRHLGSPPRSWGAGPGCRKSSGDGRFTPTLVGSRSGRWWWWTPPTVHPHARGEQENHKVGSGLSGGSPPRSWGAVQNREKIASTLRFTPTLVGSRNGNILNEDVPAGSPPRSWGAVPPRRPSTPPRRFTPTLVGSRTKALQIIRRWPVHPHARGEQDQSAANHQAMAGSPPRSWGAVPSMPCTRLIRTVHPHARGEQHWPTASAVGPSGSPPRSWGAAILTVLQVDRDRFTPTLVGSRPANVRVHDNSSGSPPRSWGAGS